MPTRHLCSKRYEFFFVVVILCYSAQWVFWPATRRSAYWRTFGSVYSNSARLVPCPFSRVINEIKLLWALIVYSRNEQSEARQSLGLFVSYELVYRIKRSCDTPTKSTPYQRSKQHRIEQRQQAAVPINLAGGPVAGKQHVGTGALRRNG